MDVTETIKMNSLIGNLTRNGKVTSFDEAVSVAGTIYSHGMPEHTMQREVERKIERNDDQDAEVRLRQRMSEMHDQMTSVTTQMNDQLSLVWNAIDELKRRKPEVSTTAVVQEAPVVSTPKPSDNAHPGDTVPQARTGGFASNDVNLEKFFYCGGGR